MECDGSRTSVKNAETGEELEGVVEVSFNHMAGDDPEVTLTLVGAEVEIGGELDVEFEREE